jgi:putative ABC transport system substrate-binding protein
MRRRELIFFLCSAAVATPRAARAQQKAMPVIGLMASSSPGPYAKQLDGFRQGLAVQGFVEGKNVAIEYRWAEGRYDRLPGMAADLVRRRVEVIAAMALPAARAAKAATVTVPIVFYSGVDPVEEGLVKSLAHPGGNLTGFAAFFVKLNPKRVQLLHEFVPNAAAFALLVNPLRRISAIEVQETQEAAQAVGPRLVVAKAGTDAELAPAFAALAGKVDAMILGPDPFFGDRGNRIVALAARYRLPAIYYLRLFADAGGLISYGDSVNDAWRQVGVYTGKVLHGAQPADLPIAQPTKFELVINLKTAKALGLTAPRILLEQADEVIE